MKVQRIWQVSPHRDHPSDFRGHLYSFALILSVFLVVIAHIVTSACQGNESITKDLGDAILRDSGAGSYYPRLVARVSPCPVVEKEGPCVRTLDGLPSSAYTVQVILETDVHESGSNVIKGPKWTTLDQSDVFVSVELHVPDNGEVLASFGGILTKDWRSWGSGGQRYFYSPSLEDLSLPERVEVLVTGSIGDPSQLDSEVAIKIELHAGGKRI